MVMTLMLLLLTLEPFTDAFITTTTAAAPKRCIHTTPQKPKQQISPSCSSLLTAHSLTTCLESLSLERKETIEQYQHLTWLDLDLRAEESEAEDNLPALMEMPLYPLSAVYLPTTEAAVNHTIVNVEPQNIQMAQDLLQLQQQLLGDSSTGKKKDDGPPLRFCAVLRAMDTGRIASVGTIMRILEAEEQWHYGTTEQQHDNIARIRLTCQAEELVEICRVENGDGWSTKRLMKSKEYLRATVRPLPFAADTTLLTSPTTRTDSSFLEKLDALSNNLKMIKTMYQLDLGSEDFPPGTLPKLGEAMQGINSSLESTDDDDSEVELKKFWLLAQEWQSVCYTLRQGQQSLLSAERNERMVEAACAKGGPLQLPIHMEDLEPDDRKEIQRLEQQLQQRHVELGLDPVLDFQVLLSLDDTSQRIQWLDHLMARERQRLERVVSLQYAD